MKIITKIKWFYLFLILLIIYNLESFENESFDNSKLTVIITASHIKSHPSTEFITEVIDSLKMINLPENTNIILAHDYKNEANYKKYLKILHSQYSNRKDIQINLRKTKGHLTGNIRDALKYVNTKYILLLQHDLPFIRNVDIHNVIEDMDENPDLKHIRFNNRENIKTNFDSLNNLFGLQQKQTNYTYTRTPGWSDQNHIALTDYYNNIIMKECKDGDFMENTIMKKSPYNHQKYGTYLFGKLNHPQMIKHTDGRQNKNTITNRDDSQELVLKTPLLHL